jgi:putative PIN family toxin of toxin-antitoxin system
MLLSRPVIAEYRDVLSREELTNQHPAITTQAVKLLVERLRYFADLVDPVRARFRYDRDPADECFIELAISGAATHLVTHDKDLLSLPRGHSEPAKRLRQRRPGLRVLKPGDLLREFEASEDMPESA